MGEIIALQDYFSSNPKVPSAPAPVADPLIVRTCCLAPRIPIEKTSVSASFQLELI
jgi:hypothetical protein